MLKKKEAKRLAEVLTSVSVGISYEDKRKLAIVVNEVVAVAVKDKHKRFFEHLMPKEQIGGANG